MQYDITKWRERYNAESIQAIIKKVKALDKNIIATGKELIWLLWGLERTKRWKEYQGYKQLAFKIFLDEICWIKYYRYNELRYAYQWFPLEAEKYGPHTIQAIKERVGVAKLPKVLAKLTTLVPSVQTGKQREELNKYINAIAPKKQRQDGADTKAYWRQQAEEYKTKWQDAIKEVREKDQMITTLILQISRQNKALNKYTYTTDTKPAKLRAGATLAPAG